MGRGFKGQDFEKIMISILSRVRTACQTQHTMELIAMEYVKQGEPMNDVVIEEMIKASRRTKYVHVAGYLVCNSSPFCVSVTFISLMIS